MKLSRLILTLLVLGALFGVGQAMLISDRASVVSGSEPYTIEWEDIWAGSGTQEDPYRSSAQRPNLWYYSGTAGDNIIIKWRYTWTERGYFEMDHIAEDPGDPNTRWMYRPNDEYKLPANGTPVSYWFGFGRSGWPDADMQQHEIWFKYEEPLIEGKIRIKAVDSHTFMEIPNFTYKLYDAGSASVLLDEGTVTGDPLYLNLDDTPAWNPYMITILESDTTYPKSVFFGVNGYGTLTIPVDPKQYTVEDKTVITGRIICNETKSGLHSAFIYVGGEGTLSRPDGTFDLSITPGNYPWKVQKSGYHPTGGYVNASGDVVDLGDIWTVKLTSEHPPPPEPPTNEEFEPYEEEWDIPYIGDGPRPPKSAIANTPFIGNMLITMCDSIDGLFELIWGLLDMFLSIVLWPIEQMTGLIIEMNTAISDSSNPVLGSSGFLAILGWMGQLINAIPPVLTNLVTLVLSADILAMFLNRPVS